MTHFVIQRSPVILSSDPEIWKFEDGADNHKRSFLFIKARDAEALTEIFRIYIQVGNDKLVLRYETPERDQQVRSS